MSLSSGIKELALELGFQSAGITNACRFEEAERAMRDAVVSGRMSVFPWFTEDRAHVSCYPSSLYGEARSIVSVSAPYSHDRPPPSQKREPVGVFARYAWGDDYHQVMKRKLVRLREQVAVLAKRPVDGPACVDTGRVAERAAAERAGTGWIGKNSMLIARGGGSWVLLGELILSLDLDPDEPVAPRCGRCTACIEACPTGAIVAPYTVDARRCISTLTIELRGSIPAELRPLMGNHVFGCDACQEVCPHNRLPHGACWDEFRPRDDIAGGLPLIDLISLSEADYHRLFAGSAIKRAKRNGLRRNALVAAGNSADPGLAGPVAELLIDPDPIVRSHAAWALGRLGGDRARGALDHSRAREQDPVVAGEIDQALDTI